MADKIIQLKQKDSNERLFPKTLAEIVFNANNETLENVEAGAQVNKIESISLNGTTQTIIDKAININLASVATSGSYNDLINTPDVNDATLTITQGGISKGTFTANASTDVTIALDAGGTVDQTYDSTSVNAQSGVAIAGALTSYQLIAQPMTSLSASGSITLSDNSVNKITATGTVTFTLPTITDTTVLHQIFIELNMSTAQTINLGTTYYFNSTAPDLSTAGTYNLYYEYDNTASHWVVGAIVKGAAS